MLRPGVPRVTFFGGVLSLSLSPCVCGCVSPSHGLFLSYALSYLYPASCLSCVRRTFESDGSVSMSVFRVGPYKRDHGWEEEDGREGKRRALASFVWA